MSTYDLAVIGSGAAGLTAASFAQQMGARTVLIEKEPRLGGDCTWVGCVPSKALIRCARAAHEARNGARFGVTASPEVDMAAIKGYIEKTIHDIYQHEDQAAIEKTGVDVLTGPARYLSDTKIKVGDQEIEAEKSILCVGGRPSAPPLDGLDEVSYYTNETFFENDRLPERLLILGAGPIGIELAQAYARLGAKVTVFGQKIMPHDDPDAVAVIRRALEDEGVEFILKKAERAEQQGDSITLHGDGTSATGDMLLVAAGRQPNVEGLDLEAAGVVYDRKGIEIDNTCLTSAENIWAAGDCTGGPQFTHYAGWQAFYAARNAVLVGSSPGKTSIVPWCTYTAPEAAHVGKTESEARKRYGSDLEVIELPMSQIDRAVCEGDTRGFLKVMTKKGVIVGATIVADRAGEMISEIALAIHHEMKVQDVAQAIHPYPSYNFALQQASSDEARRLFCESLLGKAVRRISGRW